MGVIYVLCYKIIIEITVLNYIPTTTGILITRVVGIPFFMIKKWILTKIIAL